MVALVRTGLSSDEVKGRCALLFGLLAFGLKLDLTVEGLLSEKPDGPAVAAPPAEPVIAAPPAAPAVASSDPDSAAASPDALPGPPASPSAGSP